MKVTKMTAEHWAAVAEIYREGINTGIATFETQVPSFEAWDKAHLKTCRIVAMDSNIVLGWAALSPVSSRCVYAGVAEVSVYIGAKSRGKGVGETLLKELITASEEEGIWTLQSGVFPDNVGSVKLHEKVGFRFLGKRERIGKTSKGIWKDNLLFERRSTIVGVN